MYYGRKKRVGFSKPKQPCIKLDIPAKVMYNFSCKQVLRKKILEKLNTQTKKERKLKSEKIREILFSQPQFLQADTIMLYVAKDGEVDTTGMIKDALKMGKKVAVPVTLVKTKKIILSLLQDYKKELEKGPFGIYQPKKEYMRTVPVKDVDLMIIPGVAFDRAGNRLGRGGGYFDRFLALAQKRKIPMFGLAFKFQVVKRLPVLCHDIPVTKLIYA